MIDAADILREFGIAPPPQGKDDFYTTCPKCSADRKTVAHQKAEVLHVTIDAKGVRFYCNHCQHSGGKYFKLNGKDRTQRAEIREFPYCDEAGNTLFVVHRVGNKDTKKIRQKRPDPNNPGKWIWNLKDVRIVPYKLPQTLEAIAAGHPIFVVEGEPKADLLWSWNVAATCCNGGAGKWKAEHSAFLQGADVILIPDHDNPGWDHVNKVGSSLIAIASRVRVLPLPGLKEKEDIIDWAARGGSREQFDTLVEQAQDWKALSGNKEYEERKARAKAHEDELLEQLAKAERLDYARARKEAAKELGVTPTDIDHEVQRRREDMAAAPLYGHWLTEPWPEVCDGDSLIRDIINRIRRHVVITDEAALASTLFLPFAWVHNDIATHSPILNVSSAEPESGKSTLIGLLSFLMPRCIVSVEASEAAIYRAINRWRPSFAIDEFDTVLADDSKAGLRSVINSGHTRGQGVLRCVGDDKIPELFDTFAPKIVGMVGRKLPAATLSRCIFIQLRRRKKDEGVEEFKHVDDPGLADLRRRLCRWAIDNQEALRDAKPSMPDELRNRRHDNWKLQLAIADLCSGVDQWGAKARVAAIKIESGTDNSTESVAALAATKAAFDTITDDEIASEDLIDIMASDADSDWAEYRDGKKITQAQLARLLKPYRIIPGKVRPAVHGGKQKRGYRREWFLEAWEVWL
jgi:hypothetical protein